ncbi:hypothetical protein MSAN_02399200 [Mycena sanguinolenta]|uniref:Uncharacterized protein n=1 Tax=Mycena sanguinolenta TaxID=230812 RepID=A0A8H7CEY9_9AGAR|nr:hypothetical protein MSAN_02399200 [Mycena sanguinolenta]
MSPSHPSTKQVALSPGNSKFKDEGNLIVKFLPVVVLASVCRGLSLFARYNYYHQWPAHSSSRRFNTWLHMGEIVLKVDMWAMAVSILVSFISVGWWGALGDRRGRKCVLSISILGGLLRDLIYLAVAQTEFKEHGAVVATVIEGLLGGYATFAGVAHAYISDVSTSPVSRTLNFCLLHAVTFFAFRFGAIVGYAARYNLMPIKAAFGGSVFLASSNLLYIHMLLPESSTPPPAELKPERIPKVGKRSSLESVTSPVAIFFRSSLRRSRFICLALFAYSASLAYGVKLEALLASMNQSIVSTSGSEELPQCRHLVFIVPAALSSFQATEHNDDTEFAGFLFAKTVALCSIALALLAIFLGEWAWYSLWVLFKLPYPLSFFLYPLSVAALPALYSVAASVTPLEHGGLFGSLSVWVSLGECVSYYVAGDGAQSLDYWGWAITVLVLSLVSLAAQDPPVL